MPNLVADQETERYLADYHAESDTFDKVDLELARNNAAVAAVAVAGHRQRARRAWGRGSRAPRSSAILADERKLDEQMKTYGLWADWEKRRAGTA